MKLNYQIIKEYFPNLKSERFERYRDGGTTYITVKGNKNKTYEFFYPTLFDKNKFPTFKGEELESVTKEEENTLIELLKLDLA